MYAPDRASTRTDDQAGFTLIELLVAMAVSAVVILVPLTLMVNIFGDADRIQSRTQAASAAQLQLQPLMDDLRHATAATLSTPAANSATAVLTIPTPGNGATSLAGLGLGTTQTVTWTCMAGQYCTRAVAGGGTFTKITNLVSASFVGTSTTGTTGTVNPTFVSVTVQTLLVSSTGATGTPGGTRLGANTTGRQSFTTGPTRTITVQDGVALRNFTA